MKIIVRVVILGNHSLVTESINPNTVAIDSLGLSNILTLINEEDHKIADAVNEVMPSIEHAVDALYEVVRHGGKVFFVGAGTSGRLGVLEAAECPPTFGVSNQLFQAVIAGGEKAIFKSVESAEDDEFQGQKDLELRGLTPKDAVVGIAASGKTPYVIGALKYANDIKARTVALACNQDSKIGQLAGHKIEVVVGPEVISGSTRMKAGTATKLVLNMMTTTVMIKMGKVYQNLMVDLNVSNSKLKDRAISIVQIATQVDEERAAEVLKETGFDVKTAIVMLTRSIDINRAKQLIEQSNGFVRKAIDKSYIRDDDNQLKEG